jgi:hypothetical protein
MLIFGFGSTMAINTKTACFVLCFGLSALAYAQNNAGGFPPEALRMPLRGEAPRYPSDIVIGELGQGEAPQGAYIFAQTLLSALTRGDSGRGVSEETKKQVNDLRPRSYRLGGGRTEPDGCVSFLLRFLGQNESAAGELFVRQEEAGNWILDDLILEENRALSDIRDSYRDFSPYERFY